MGNYDDPSLAGSPARRRLRPLLPAVVVALLVGGGAGYTVRALLPAPSVPRAPASTGTPAPTPAPGPTASCSAASDVGAALVAQLQRAAVAMGNLDPATLSDVLDQVQRLQGELEAAVHACTGSPGG